MKKKLSVILGGVMFAAMIMAYSFMPAAGPAYGVYFANSVGTPEVQSVINFSSTTEVTGITLENTVVAYTFIARNGTVYKMRNSTNEAFRVSILQDTCDYNQQPVYYKKGDQFWFKAATVGCSLEYEFSYVR